MTLSAYINEEWAADVATTTGWGDFLDVAEGVAELRQLVDEGFCESPENLRVGLDKVMEKPISPSVQGVVEGLQEAMRDMEEGDVFIVSDGLGDEDGDNSE
jgi:hypothetical protein